MLTTVASMKELLGIPEGETGQDAACAAWITAASEMIEAYCCREFELKERADVFPEFDGRRALLRAYPVAQVHSVELGGAEAHGWYVDKGSGALALPDTRSGRLVVVYTGGYALPGALDESAGPKLPETLRIACELLAKAIANAGETGSAGVASERIGDYSVSYRQTGGEASAEPGLPAFAPTVAALVRPYVGRWS